MLCLVDLPEEILIIIIRLLDTTSIYNLYKTCQQMRDMIKMQGVIRVCNLSLNTLATVKSLQLRMVKLISDHLHELNMCGVTDLTKSLLLPAIKRMKCLKTLNVAYTKIHILDLLDLYKKCPTIINLTMNFQFQSPEMIKLPDELLHECQEVFKNFVNVHFILKSWFSNLPLHVLKKSTLSTLTYTVCDWPASLYQSEELATMISFKHFCIFMLNWELVNSYQGSWNLLLPLVKLGSFEFIILEYDTSYSLCTSPLFAKFFMDNFQFTTFISIDLLKPMQGNVAILLWNKETTIFDDLFFCNLKKRIKSIFSCEVEVSTDVPLSLGVATQSYEWFHFCLNQPDGIEKRSEYTGPEFKKIRTGQAYKTLNYDTTFKDCQTIKLSMSFMSSCAVTLSSNSEYLRKLTYLNLKGSVVRYSNEFFNLLFRCCEKLVTLNVESSPVHPCSSPIMRSIPLSRSIKNIRLVDARIDFKMLFSSFSQCVTLENICIIDISTDFNGLANPTTLYKKCSNLYNLYIRASMSERAAVKKLKMLNNAKKICSKYCINVTLHNSHEGMRNGYNPYMHVFNLRPIKPV